MSVSYVSSVLYQLFKTLYGGNCSFPDLIQPLQFLCAVLSFALDERSFPHGSFYSVFNSVVFKVCNLVGCQIAKSRFKCSENGLRPVFFNHSV